MSITVENLTHIYNKGLAYETTAVDSVSFSIDDGEFVGIIGHTGSGKSTLIQHLNGILRSEIGKIYIDDVEITSKDVKMTDIRKKVGLVFQYPEYQLFEETVVKDIGFGPKNLGLSDEEIDERVRLALSLVGLPYEEFESRSPFDLSGGQKRRVAIAGVIAMRPNVLILDEPTAGLDPKAHREILEMIDGIRTRTGTTIILVSHNMGDVGAMANRVLVMDKGKLIMNGTPREVFNDSEHLKEIGLSVPPSTELANMLAEGGMVSDEIILTENEIVDFVVKSIGEKTE